MTNYSPFDNLLNESTTVEVDGEAVETVNVWSFAAMILGVYCDPSSPVNNPSGYSASIEMAKEAIAASNPDINAEELMSRAKNGNEGALKQAHALIAMGIDILADEQFGQK
jgi:hypothetical protein